MAHIDDKIMFAQLVCLFAVFINDKPLPIALVQPFDRWTSPPHAKKDRELSFLRLRRQDIPCFIWARSIVRGVPIFPAFDNEKDSIVFDLADADMLLRISDILAC